MTEPVPLTDIQRVNEIRELVKKLSSSIKSAKEAGLTVNVSLADVGNHSFAYRDAVTILRKY